MNGKRTPSYDPADVIIAHTLKAWVKYPEFPGWVRTELLSNVSQSVVKASSRFMLRMIFKWVLLRGVELISLLLAEDSMIFLPSRMNYYYNPPHLKPCAVQARVRDTFLLEAGMLVGI